LQLRTKNKKIKKIKAVKNKLSCENEFCLLVKLHNQLYFSGKAHSHPNKKTKLLNDNN